MADLREIELAIEKNLREIDRRKRESAIDTYHPYPKQMDFHAMGATKRERLLMAGNQNGKTYCGGAEVTLHTTGLYPDWWTGRRWTRPTRGWVSGVTGESTRDNPQRILFGTKASGLGSGLIPKSALDRERLSLARGVSDFYDTILVKHFDLAGRAHGAKPKQDGWSEIKQKSYERGAEKFQGDTLDWFWMDEEPPWDVYEEQLARITATSGMGFITFTPLKGMSEVVLRFLDQQSPDRGYVTMTIDDAEHIPKEERAKIIAGFDARTREARTLGIPAFGEGKIFHALEENIRVTPFDIPRHWRWIWGIDFGTGHPFAAVLLAHDTENDVIYVIHCIRMTDSLPLQQAEAMKRSKEGHGGKIPAAWPQDGTQRKEYDGKLEPLAKIFKKHGIKMCHEHARWEDGSNSTEAGITDMQERMASGRFKVFSSCMEWFEEYRSYHRRKNPASGKVEINRIKDDIMSGTRIGVMAIRFARPVFFHNNTPNGRAPVQMAIGVDDDPW